MLSSQCTEVVHSFLTLQVFKNIRLVVPEFNMKKDLFMFKNTFLGVCANTANKYSKVNDDMQEDEKQKVSSKYSAGNIHNA